MIARRTNFVAAFWRGEYSLPLSFWAISLLVGLATQALVMLTTPALASPDPRVWFAIFFSLWALVFVIGIWQLVGTWRSASNYAAVRRRAGRGAAWAAVAKIFLLLAALRMLLALFMIAIPQITEGARIAFFDDPDIPAYEIKIVSDTEIALVGGIKFGIEAALERALAQNPSTTQLTLDSVGGRIDPAIRLHDIVSARGLTTVVYNECSSSCTIVLVGGRERRIGSLAHIGFHAASAPGTTAQDQARLNADMRAALLAAGVDAAFIATALSVSADTIWYPTPTELLIARVATRITDDYPPEHLAAILTRSAAEVAARLPTPIDEVTDFVSIAASGNTLTFGYAVDGAQVSRPAISALIASPPFIAENCRNAAALLRAGALLRSRFFVAAELVAELELTRAVCPPGTL